MSTPLLEPKTFPTSFQLIPSLLTAMKVSSTSGPTSKIQRSSPSSPLPVSTLSMKRRMSVPPLPSETNEHPGSFVQLLSPA